MRRVTAADQAHRDSGNPSLSADASLLAFASDADLLGQGIPDDQFEVWLYHTGIMTYTRVTTSAGTGRDSTTPVLSADASTLAFSSDADLLGQGNVVDGQHEIWLYDTAARTYTRVTTGASGRVSVDPALNASGTLVAFASDADLLGQGTVADGQQEVWLYDTKTLTYTRVTTGTSGRTSENPVLDAAGSLVAFDSDADLLGQGIPSGQFEVWLYDTVAMTYTRVTTATEANRSSGSPSLDASAALLAFTSDADLLGQGIPDGQYEVWLYDRAALTYTRVTTATDANRDSYAPHISADGTAVVFVSDADLLGQGIPDDQFEVWRYDVPSGTLVRLTWASDIDRDSYNPVLSADGEAVAFTSDADLLAQTLPDDQFEIWLYHPRRVYLPTALCEYP
jgi:Tol biopolymer transport system component